MPQNKDGDGEAGDSPWLVNSTKSLLQPEFRQTFGKYFNKNRDNGNFLFDAPELNTSSRPFGTIYNETSFAYQYKNVLFVTVDIWYQEDPSEAINGDDTVKGAVEGEHLLWLESVLREAKKIPEIIKHVFVQAHLPILWPIRRLSTNGTSMDGGSSNSLWKLMRQYQVDAYFCGDVHAHTVTKDPESNLIQIASRGINFNSFLTVDVSHDTIDITSHNEMGENQQGYNYNYTINGRVLIHKAGDDIQFDSSGELKFVDISGPLIHFDFEKIVPFKETIVTGMYESHNIQPRNIKAEDILTQDTLLNIGAFGQVYDAKVTNLTLVTDGDYGKAGNFSEYSHTRVSGIGPHNGGNIVSYSLWFKTSTPNTILLSYSGFSSKDGSTTSKITNIILDESGRIQFLYSQTQKLVGTKFKNLNDNNWHYAVITMPHKNCLLSEIRMLIDGKHNKPVLTGNNEAVNYFSNGVISLGGYRNSVIPDNYDINKNHFIGLLDEVGIWGRSLTWKEVRNEIIRKSKLTKPPTKSPALVSSHDRCSVNVSIW